MSKSELLFNLNPKAYQERIEEKSKYADIEDYEELSVVIGGFGVLASALIAVALPYSLTLKLAALLISATLLYFLLPFTVLSVAAERRKNEMERMLPEALLLISTNLESGASINRAFLEGAREEFGPLKKEFQTTSRQISGGTPVEKSLGNLRERVNSDLFKDTLRILTNTLEAGGNTAELLESSAEDIRKSLELREEIKSSIQMYVIFILIAAVIGAPFLFGITTYMAERTTQLWQQTNPQTATDFAGGGSGISFQEPSINLEYLTMFSITILVITNFFASLIISQIKNGNIKEGFKIIPFTVAASVVIFFFVRNTLSGII